MSNNPTINPVEIRTFVLDDNDSAQPSEFEQMAHNLFQVPKSEVDALRKDQKPR